MQIADICNSLQIYVNVDLMLKRLAINSSGYVSSDYFHHCKTKKQPKISLLKFHCYASVI